MCRSDTDDLEMTVATIVASCCFPCFARGLDAMR